jgi:hypothetical protein
MESPCYVAVLVPPHKCGKFGPQMVRESDIMKAKRVNVRDILQWVLSIIGSYLLRLQTSA